MPRIRGDGELKRTLRPSLIFIVTIFDLQPTPLTQTQTANGRLCPYFCITVNITNSKWRLTRTSAPTQLS